MAVMLACAPVGPAAPPGVGPLPTQAWPLEVVELRDGRRLAGLILGDAADGPPAPEDEISIVQVVRPPGRPMYLVTWGPIPGDRIETLTRLPQAARRTLAERIGAFRAERTRRPDVEAALPLEREGEDGPWRYAGPDFTVESRADPAITRSAVVRLERVFGALAALVPPRAGADPEPLQVRLCGSAAEYRAVQESLGVALDNPAFYVPLRRLLVAGSDTADLIARAAAAGAALDAAERRYAELDRTLAERLRALAADLEEQGVAPAARGEIVNRARSRWERERAAALTGIETARRVNTGAVSRARGTFHARLAHEAWHAYADGRLRAPGAAGLPLWLDEGIAQVVESAPLEAGELRLDAPDPDRLTRLQQAFRAGRVPPLADVLRAGQERFLSGHVGSDGGLVYLTAWGLALDAALLRPVLSAAALAALEADGADPVAAFESLVGMPLERYEPAWRRRILGLRPATPVKPDG